MSEHELQPHTPFGNTPLQLRLLREIENMQGYKSQTVVIDEQNQRIYLLAHFKTGDVTEEIPISDENFKPEDPFKMAVIMNKVVADYHAKALTESQKPHREEVHEG